MGVLPAVLVLCIAVAIVKEVVISTASSQWHISVIIAAVIARHGGHYSTPNGVLVPHLVVFGFLAFWFWFLGFSRAKTA